jgi:oligoribonuclease NrnB/cAMP/cGMP phosphodiesterase (DHH superfamily)
MNFDGVVWLDIFNRLVWIDHHKSSIDSHPAVIGGYRIDGVAACRLAWQWFAGDWHKLEKHNILLQPNIQDFLERKVSEPWALTLAGEYDVWIHRGDGSFEFQFGLDAQTEAGFQELLSPNEDGVLAMNCYAKRDADIIRERSFLMEWEGLKFLTLNTPKCNSNTFKVRDIPETGHDAIMAFFWNGKKWIFSLYHAAHNRDIDLSLIAKKYGGGVHRGACGFQVNKLPFELSA